MRIMVVDDSQTMRRIVIMNLKKAGYANIVEAEHGKMALDLLEASPDNGRPDVILLDWNMPEMSGMDFLKAVKKIDKFKDIPVIMVTTEAEKERVLAAVQAGAAGYLVKPLTPESFQKQVIERIQNN